jgi:hypothetical protein
MAKRKMQRRATSKVKKKPIKKKEVISVPGWRLKAEDTIKETGAKPYNAAILGGATHEEALTFAGIERYKYLATLTYSDIAEQEGATPRKIIRHLIQRSGINNREEGAREIKGNDDSFVEVPSDKIQLAYLKELNGIMELGAKEGETDPNAQKNRPFDIMISIPEGSKYVQRDIELIIKGKKNDADSD